MLYRLFPPLVFFYLLYFFLALAKPLLLLTIPIMTAFFYLFFVGSSRRCTCFMVFTSRCSPFSISFTHSLAFRLTSLLLTPPYRSNISLLSIPGFTASCTFFSLNINHFLFPNLQFPKSFFLALYLSHSSLHTRYQIFSSRSGASCYPVRNTTSNPHIANIHLMVAILGGGTFIPIRCLYYRAFYPSSTTRVIPSSPSSP